MCRKSDIKSKLDYYVRASEQYIGIPYVRPELEEQEEEDWENDDGNDEEDEDEDDSDLISACGIL